MSELQKFGAVQFENETPGRGWACVFGGAPFEVNGVEDLATDTIWWTNLTFERMRQLNIHMVPRLRSEGYLRTGMHQIARELGLEFLERPGEAVEYLAMVFAYTIRASVHLGLVNVAPQSLVRGFRERFFGRKAGFTCSNEILHALQEANQPYVFCQTELKPSEGEVQVPLIRRRYLHAMTLLKEKYPAGAFTPVSMNRLPTSPSELAAFEKPLMLRVVIRDFDNEVAKLINYGATPRNLPGNEVRTMLASGGHASKMQRREWMSQNEYNIMRLHADIDVQGALMGECFRHNEVEIPELPDKAEYSYAFGLALENLWMSMTRTWDGREDVTPRSVWMHSIDRSICFLWAKKIMSKCRDAEVTGYGYGRINVRLPYYNGGYVETVAEMVDKTELIPPIMERALPWAITQMDPTVVMQVLMIRGHRKYLMHQDGEILKAIAQAA